MLTKSAYQVFGSIKARRKMMRVRTLCLFLDILVAISATAASAETTACDRNCLTRMVDEYLAAMVKHDPAGLPLAPNDKFTENTGKIDVGDGLWVGASNVSTTFRIYAADPVSGQVGFMGVLKEFGKPVLLVLRLKVANGQITEIEHIVVRQVGGFGPYGTPGHMNLETSRPAFAETVPPSERVPREEMVRIANSYFDAIEQTNGKTAPFADDCVRHENGAQTTTWDTPDPLADAVTNAISALGCASQIDSGELSYITRIQPRRLLIVDEEKGLVFSFPMFVHRAVVRSVKLTGVPGIQSHAKEFAPFTLLAGELFKIRGGKIHEIEAFGTSMPNGIATGWE
jgi:hypothetical protein